MSLLDPPPEIALRDRLRMMAGNLGFFLRVIPWHASVGDEARIAQSGHLLDVRRWQRSRAL
jgi:hypothetical protein